MLDLPPPAIIEPAPAELREFADKRRFRRELLDTTREAVLPGLMAAPLLGSEAYGYSRISANQFNTPNANQMAQSTSGLTLVTSSHTPTALTENLYSVSCRFNTGPPTDLTLTDSLGSTYDVVAGPTMQGTGAAGIITKIFRLRTTVTSARTLTAGVTGGGIAATLGFNIHRLTYANPLGLTLMTTLVETAQAEGTTVTLNSTPYGDLNEVYCISGTNGITTPADCTRFGNASWSNGGNGSWSVTRNDVPFSLGAGRTRTSASGIRLICHVLHIYFQVIRTARQPVLALTDTQFTASATTTTRNYTLQIGQARTDRIVIVAIHFNPDSVGSAMPLNAAYLNSDTTQVGVNILNAFPYSNPVPRTIVYWHVPTGTTVPLTLTLGAASTKVALSVWTLRGCADPVHTDSGQDADTAAITVQNISNMDIRAGAVAIASNCRRTGGAPPLNPTVWTPTGWAADAADLGPPAGANGALSPARRTNNTASTIVDAVTATFSVASSNGGSLVAASFGP